MLNVVDLEKRWIRYKIKSYIPHLSIFISIFVIVSIFISFSNTTQEIQKTSVQDVVPPVVVGPKVIEPSGIVPQEPQVIHSSKTVKLSPSLDFMRKMQNSVQPYYQNEMILSQQSTHAVQTPKQVQAPKTEVVQRVEVIVPKQIVKSDVKKVSIKRQNTQNDIYEIIARFKKNNNPALSLFVAKKYYELEDYQQAYNYALITNKINKEIESSWIIFAKSLVKLGKRDKAISTLKQYIKQSHSSSARILLDEIYGGKF